MEEWTIMGVSEANQANQANQCGAVTIQLHHLQDSYQISRTTRSDLDIVSTCKIMSSFSSR